jgi:uncharacterized damage-inducible protein DinB
MTAALPFLKSIYDGWDSHQLALVRAITPLTREQLAWRPAPHLRSVGELISHMVLARLWWFYPMGAPGAAFLARQVAPWAGETINPEDPSELVQWADALEKLEGALVEHPPELLRWLEASWQMIETTLTTWTIADLTRTYRRMREGEIYVVSRQWTIWRILSHDLHHGGELALRFGLQGIDVPGLGERGGHLTQPPLADQVKTDLKDA